MSEPVYAGIDVAKVSFGVAASGKAQALSLAKDEAGHAHLCKVLMPLAPRLILLEAPVAKTDRIDAQVLRDFGVALDAQGHEPRALLDGQQRELTPLVTRRRQLVAMLIAERQRLALAHSQAKASILAIMDAIAAQLPQMDG